MKSSLRHVHNVVIANGSEFPFEIKSFGRPVGQGKDVAVIKIEVRNAPALKIDESRGPELQDHVTVFGYPGAAESQLLAKPASLEVSITDGRVSARKTMADAAPVLQISAPATHGNSGGPVLNDAGQVIGLLTFGGDQVRGQEVTGFSFVVPSSTVLEFVRTAGAANVLGDIDKRYQEGLNFFWQKQKDESIRKFEEVRRLFPQHSEVTRLISLAETFPGPVVDPPFPWRTVMIAAVAVLALGGIGMLFMKRQRPGATPSETTRVPPASGASRPTSSSPAVSRHVPPPMASDEEDATVRSGFIAQPGCHYVCLGTTQRATVRDSAGGHLHRSRRLALEGGDRRPAGVETARLDRPASGAHDGHRPGVDQRNVPQQSRRREHQRGFPQAG